MPEDNKAHGFDNIGEALDLSAVHLERYMAAATKAIDAAIRKTPKPEAEVNKYGLADGKNANNIGKHWHKTDDGAVVVFNNGGFLAIGNDRSKENAVFGNLWASDDLGKSWKWLEPTLLNQKCDGYSGIVSNGQRVVIADKSGANVFLSQDAGDLWSGPFATGLDRATLNLVGDEFWLVSKKAARASSDGETWRDLPRGIPTGKVIASPTGTLISIDRQRFNILRSTDGGESWQEAYKFQPETEVVHGAQGLRDIAFGYVTSEPISHGNE